MLTSTARRPRALMIAPSLPARTGSGYAMRFGIFLEALARVAEVDLVVPVVLDDAPVPGSLPASLGILTSAFPTLGLHDTHFALLSQLPDARRRAVAFRAYGRPSAAAGISARTLSYMAALGRERKYDLVHVERVYLAEAGLAAATAGTHLSLDLDEDDYDSMRSQAELLRGRGAAAGAEWLSIDADATDRLVARVAGRFATKWISSEEDQASLRLRHPTLSAEVLPNAVEVPPDPQRRDDGATLLFVGSLGYLPNAEGILWFARAVWPALRARAARPLRIVIAGPNAPRAIAKLARPRVADRLRGREPAFRVLGRVADLRPVYEEATVAIAPLRGGRGTRLKLLEAAAQGMPIVATPDAARGLPDTPPWAWIARDAETFADACLAALEASDARARRIANGRALVARGFDRSTVITDLAASFATLLETDVARR